MITRRESGPADAVITIGVFDGVHRGHQALIGQVVDRARELGVVGASITFRPHPQEVLNPGTRICRLATLEDRIALIQGLGVTDVVTVDFTPSLARLSPEEFIDLVNSRFRIRELWVGSNFALGRNRSGTPGRLATIGSAMGFSVHSFNRVEIGGEAVSSSRIRALLAEGQVEDSRQLLGRRYRLSGKVVSGDGRARSFGFATANLDVEEGLCLPRDGVYAVLALTADGRPFRGVCNIGVRPTFEGNARLVEVHLIGFKGDLYGNRLVAEFVARLRDERRFPSPEALVDQISADVRQADRLARDVLPASS